MRIVLMGPPGAGKGTQSARLFDYLGVPHLSSGEMLRDAQAAATDLGIRAAEFFQAGKLVPDDLVLEIVLARLENPDCELGSLFDGFPRTVLQAQQLDQLLADRQTPLDLAVEVRISEPELLERLAQRGRVDDNEDAIRERLKQYGQLTKPVIGYYHRQGILHSVDGEGTPDEVFGRIQEVVDEYRD